MLIELMVPGCVDSNGSWLCIYVTVSKAIDRDGSYSATKLTGSPLGIDLNDLGYSQYCYKDL